MAQRSPAPESPIKHVVVAIRSSVSVSQRSLGGRNAVVLHNEETGKFYHLGAEEAVVASLLDGSLSIGQIVPRLQSVGIVWDIENIWAFVTLLTWSGL